MKSAARNIIWILIFAAAIAVYVLIAKPAESAQIETTPPVQVYELRKGRNTETWLYTADPASATALNYTGTCVPDDVGVWYEDEDGNPVLVGHGTIDVQGMVAHIDADLGEHEVAGGWFRFKKPWMRHGGPWDSLPFGVQMLDGTWKEPWVAQCVDSWQIWPFVTSGPAQPGEFILFVLLIAAIIALHGLSNRRPTPPMLSDLLGIAPDTLAGEPSETVVARIRSAWDDGCQCDLQDTPNAPADWHGKECPCYRPTPPPQ